MLPQKHAKRNHGNHIRISHFTWFREHALCFKMDQCIPFSHYSSVNIRRHSRALRILQNYVLCCKWIELLLRIFANRQDTTQHCAWLYILYLMHLRSHCVRYPGPRNIVLIHSVDDMDGMSSGSVILRKSFVTSVSDTPIINALFWKRQSNSIVSKSRIISMFQQ